MVGNGMNVLIAKDFEDIKPVTVRNAALLLREAANAVADTEQALGAANTAQLTAEKAHEHAVKEYRLKVSAMQPNGGEA